LHLGIKDLQARNQGAIRLAISDDSMTAMNAERKHGVYLHLEMNLMILVQFSIILDYNMLSGWWYTYPSEKY
jgi:hypothetical protein